MVNPSELRVGNYVLYNNQPVMVFGISVNAVMLNGFNQEIAVNESIIRPIPLVDTILQKVRSRIPSPEGLAYSYYGAKATFLIYPEHNGCFIGLNNRGKVFRVTPHIINYLHQLQNIFYAQYGVEMEINEGVLSRAVAMALEYGEF